MAQKRMFSKRVIDADKFVDMPAQSQALYFHLALKSDDEGFVSGPNKIIRMLSLDKKYFDYLVENEYIYLFESGICLIRHWYLHNTIRKDRVCETIYHQEKGGVELDERNVYLLVKDTGETKQKADKKPMSDKCQADARQMSPQKREDKKSIDKDSIDKERVGEDFSLSDTKLADLLDSPDIDFPYKITPKALSVYTKQMDFECIAYAINEAKTMEKLSIGYVRAVLDRLLKDGITSKDKLRSAPKVRHGPSSKPVNDGEYSHKYNQQDYDNILERLKET